MKTYQPKAEDVDRKWYVVDAEGQTLGRLASRIAAVLRGKHKPVFAPNVDVGDYVVVVNAEKVELTGNKMSDKKYYRHSRYPGGLRVQTAEELLRKKPEDMIERAVRGMLPKNRLGRRLFKKLKVYSGPDHPHEAQEPEPLEI